jgi:hypothetical protein
MLATRKSGTRLPRRATTFHICGPSTPKVTSGYLPGIGREDGKEKGPLTLNYQACESVLRHKEERFPETHLAGATPLVNKAVPQ